MKTLRGRAVLVDPEKPAIAVVLSEQQRSLDVLAEDRADLGSHGARLPPKKPCRTWWKTAEALGVVVVVLGEHVHEVAVRYRDEVDHTGGHGEVLDRRRESDEVAGPVTCTAAATSPACCASSAANTFPEKNARCSPVLASKETVGAQAIPKLGGATSTYRGSDQLSRSGESQDSPGRDCPAG